MTLLTCFEKLPDEIILQICSYLYGADVLYSLYNLNIRLNATITGYCRYVDLRGVTYHRFDHVASHILPQIASFVQSFVFHGRREKILSAKAFATYYARPMSFIFPQLQRVRLNLFTSEGLLLFINILQDLSQLIELNIACLKGAVDETLLMKVLGANNSRLESVSFDQDSIFLDIPTVDQTVSYSNIQKLTVKITQAQMLPHLFVLVPFVHRLYVSIEERSFGPKNLKLSFDKPSPLNHLIDFHLNSVNLWWHLDEIDAVLQQMSSLQTLTLELSTDDTCIIKQENFVKILPPYLQQIRFFICYHFSESDFDVNSLTSSWSLTLPINCLLDEINKTVFMFTASFGPRLLDLPAVVGKHIIRDCKYTEQVVDLCVYNSTSLADLFLTVQHFHRLQKLCINAKKIPEACTLTPLKQPTLLNLPQLKHLDVMGKCSLFDVVKAAPNLHDLIIDFDCLKILTDDESICDLLQQQITYLDVRFWPDDASEVLQRLTRVFRSLRYLCLILKNPNISDESMSTILAQSNIKQLTTLTIGGKVSDEINRNLRQWVIDHTHLTTEDSFGVLDYSNCFSLWK